MIGHIDLLIEINHCEKKIGELNSSIKFGNYGSQVIQQLIELKKRKERELVLLKELRSLYYMDL